MSSALADAFATLLQAQPRAPVAWTASGIRDRAALSVAADACAGVLAPLPPCGRVAVSVRDGFSFLAGMLAIWRRGDCAVLLDAADPQAPRLDLARQFGAGGVLVDEPVLRCMPLAGGVAAAGLAAIKLTSARPTCRAASASAMPN